MDAIDNSTFHFVYDTAKKFLAPSEEVSNKMEVEQS